MFLCRFKVQENYPLLPFEINGEGMTCVKKRTQKIGENMTFAELVALSTDIHTQIYEHWSIFISIHLALLGGLFAFDLDVKTSFKWGFLLFYVLFAGINFAISLNLLNQVDAIALDIQAFASDNATHLETYLLRDELKLSKPVLIVAHFISGLMVLVGVFIPSKNQAKI